MIDFTVMIQCGSWIRSASIVDAGAAPLEIVLAGMLKREGDFQEGREIPSLLCLMLPSWGTSGW